MVLAMPVSPPCFAGRMGMACGQTGPVWRVSDGGGLGLSLVDLVGDCVAAEGESDHDGVLSGGGVCGQAAAVEGAVEGVVEGFGVFAPAVAAVVEAVAGVEDLPFAVRSRLPRARPGQMLA